MTTSHEPCGIEVPSVPMSVRIAKGVWIDKRDFSVWLTPEALTQCRLKDQRTGQDEFKRGKQ